MAQFHKLSIQTIIKETNKSVSIGFNVPENLKNSFSFSAGQYVTLKTEINGQDIRRDYSICVSPKSGELKVAVKEVENGTFSVYANQILKTGQNIEVSIPKGRFIFIPENKNIALFAAGSGITPILSIIKCALQETENNIILVYGNKTPKDTMFFDELLALQKNNSNRFFIQFVFSESNETGAVFGRIETSTVNLVLKNKYKHINIDDFYICGPEAMIYKVKDTLINNGFTENSIHFELFKASSTTENTSTYIEEETITGSVKATIIVDDETETIEISEKQTILEAALNNDIDAPYSCQGGICSSCLARITKGKATMKLNSILTESEIQEGLVLTCQAHPTTALITIDFDDV